MKGVSKDLKKYTKKTKKMDTDVRKKAAHCTEGRMRPSIQCLNSTKVLIFLVFVLPRRG